MIKSGNSAASIAVSDAAMPAASNPEPTGGAHRYGPPSREGGIVAEGTGLFVTVTMEHFTKNQPEDWRAEAKKRGIELPW